MCNGTIYFICTQNFQVSLHDPIILDTLVLNIHFPKLKFQVHRQGYMLLYRIYFKQITSQFNPRCLLQDDRGKTSILDIQTENQDTIIESYTLKLLKWNEISISLEWHFNTPQIPRNLANKEVTQIEENSSGQILLKI